MNCRDEQRAVLKHYAATGKTATQAFENIKKTFGRSALSRTRAFDWFKQFKEGRESVKDQRGGGCPKFQRTEEKIKAVERLVKADARVTVREIAEDTCLSVGTVYTILTKDLGLSRVCARWVPRLLTEENMEAHIQMARDLTKMYFEQGQAFLRSIVTMDESWLCHYTPELKSQSSMWIKKGGKAPIKAKRERSTKKFMYIPFFDCEGVIYNHYVKKGTKINSAYMVQVFRKFLDHFRRKRPQLYNGNWYLHFDNCRVHTSQETTAYLERRNVKLLTHAPYSPDLAPADFFLFPELKKKLAGTRFESDQELKTTTEGYVKALTKNGLLHVFEKWMHRLDKCIQLGGSYVEK